MRFLLLVLIALAVGKVGTQSYLRQQAANETIIDAYREHALAACRQHVHRQRRKKRVASNRSFSVSSNDRQIDVELIIGKSNLNVRLWQTSHPMWSARYRDPFLIVRSSRLPDTICEYDIKRGQVVARAASPNQKS